MNEDAKLIVDYMFNFGGIFLNPKEISKGAGGKSRFRRDPSWSLPILLRLELEKVVESNPSGQFRLTQKYMSDNPRNCVHVYDVGAKTLVLEDCEPFVKIYQEKAG